MKAFPLKAWLLKIGLFTVLLSSAGIATLLAQETIYYIGRAYDLEQPDQLLYEEHHQLVLENNHPLNRHVKYYSAQGELIAQKFNDYSSGLTTPSFNLVDLRDQYSEAATLTENGWQLSQRKNGTEKMDVIEASRYPLIVDAGFDEFVREHWQTLMAGNTMSFSFAAPARQDTVAFRLKPVEQSEQQLTVEMRLKSRMLSWLMAPIVLTYDLNDQKLLSYRGVTNIRDQQGQAHTALILYHYPSVDPLAIKNSPVPNAHK